MKCWTFPLFRLRALLLVLMLSLAGGTSYAQFDTNYVQLYKHKLVVSIFQSYRYQNLQFAQNAVADSSGLSRVNYKCSSRLVNGFSFDWDKLSFSLSWKTPIDENEKARRGESKVRNLAIGINTRDRRIESSYRFYKGFYDENIANIDDWSDSSAYYQNPELSIRSFKIKSIRFFNKKRQFSYRAAYGNTHRQLRSAIAFVVVSNLTYQRIRSEGDIIPLIVPDSFYTSYRTINKINTLGYSVHAGASLNLVIFKRFFGNATIAFGPQVQYRGMFSPDGKHVIKELKFQMNSADARFSLGYNGEKFLVYSWLIGDFDNMSFPDMTIYRQFITGGFSIGYRFTLKERETTRRLKENKWYKML